MGIKRNIGIVLGGVVFYCNAVMAGQMYSIDPTQSYVKAYVPSWIRGQDFNLFTQDGQNVVSIPTWTMQENLTTFSLSGSFDGTTVLSPWAPDVGHFTISQQDFKVDTPAFVAFNPASLVTFSHSTGNIYDNNPFGDPYYGSLSFPGICACFAWLTPFPPYWSGVFDGKTLEIQGGSGGNPGVIVGTYYGENPPPLDLSLLSPRPYTYQIVATSVPEPGTLPLIFLGIVVLYQVNNRHRVAS